MNIHHNILVILATNKYMWKKQNLCKTMANVKTHILDKLLTDVATSFLI